MTHAAYWKGMCHFNTESQQQLSHKAAAAGPGHGAQEGRGGTYARGEEFKEICSGLGLEADLGQRGLRLAQRFAKRTTENSCHQDMLHAWTTPTTRGAGSGGSGRVALGHMDNCLCHFYLGF